MKFAAQVLVVRLLSVPAFAGGPVEPVEYPAVAAPAPVMSTSDWSGGYVGLQFDTITSGDLTQSLATFDVDGNLYGLTAGYRRDFGRFVLGGEIDYMVGDGDITEASGAVTAVDFDRLTRLGAEFGYDMGRALVYGTAGIADIKISIPTGSLKSSGYFYGAGMDFLATDRVSVGLEVLRHQFDDFGGAAVGSELNVTTVGLNAMWNF
jgi:outer membrane immunogenic protein